MTCPPSNFPSGFVCAGKTISVISEREALTGFPGISALVPTLPPFFLFIRTPSSSAILDPARATV